MRTPTSIVTGLLPLLTALLLLAGSASPAVGQYTPTDPETLKRLAEQRRQQREQRDAETRDADSDASAKADPSGPTDRQIKLLSRASQAIGKAEQQIFTGEHRTAARTLMRIRRVLNKPRVARIEGLLGRIALLEEDHRQAMRFVEPWAAPGIPGSDKPDAYDRDAFEAHLAAGDALLARDEPGKALRLLDWLTGAETEAANEQAIGSPDAVRAAEATGRALMAMERYKDALDAFRFARRYARSQMAEYLGDEPLKSALSRARANAKKAQRLWDIERYGEAFVLFRDAERLRRGRGDHKRALPIYREIIAGWPESPFAEAARLYEGLCLVELDQLHAAERKLTAFHKADPEGLWRGEALLMLGRIALEHRLNPRVADRRFEQLDDWIAAVREQEGDWEHAGLVEGIRDAARGLVRPPGKKEYRDRWGNLKKHRIEAGELVNRKTAPWYVDDLEAQCAKYRGFLAFTRGENDAALEQYARIPELDPEISAAGSLGSNPNDYHRLKFGAENGYLFAYPEELDLYSGRLRFAVLLADFYYVTRRFDRADEVCTRILSDELGRLDPEQRDYAWYLRGTARYRGGWKAGGNSGRAALAEYEKVLNRREETYTELRAMHGFGMLAHAAKDEAVRERGWRMWMELIRSGRDHPYVHRARISMAIVLREDGQLDKALALLRGLESRNHPSWEKVAEHYDQKFRRLAKRK